MGNGGHKRKCYSPCHSRTEDLPKQPLVKKTLRLPQEVQQLMGRLVGYYEQRRKGLGTLLDLPVEIRNNHIRQQSLLIGCGGGFLQQKDACARFPKTAAH